MGSQLTGSELLQLHNIIVDNFTESNWLELGALTNMFDQVENHPRLLRSLSFGDEDYRGISLKFIKRMIGANDGHLQIVQGYLDEKYGGLEENISSVEKEEKSIVFSPNIFERPTDPIDPNLISVMMSFGKELNPVYKSIKKASTKVGFTCKRVDDIWDHSTIIQDIFSLIFCSYIVVCDFTGKNPNVFYEAGIAHTLGKHVVPITQSELDIPFDLQHHRYIKYLNNDEGVRELKKNLTARFDTLSDKRHPKTLW